LAEARDFRISRWTAEFVDAQVESAFREATHETWVRQTQIAIAISAVFYLIFAFSDYLAIGSGSKYTHLFITRMAVCALGLSVALSANRFWRPLVNGITPTITVSVAMLGFLSITLLRPFDVGWHGMSLMAMLLGAYAFIPNRFVPTLLIGISSTIGFIWLMLGHFELALNRILPLSLLLFSTNLLGGLSLHRLSWNRRAEYRHTQNIRDTNERLAGEIQARQDVENKLRDLAMRDPLTDLHNRRYFFDQAEMRLQAAQHVGVSVSMLLVDIDYFRQINETYSHVRGDELLRCLANICREKAPQDSLVARHSGEEFVLLLPGHTKADAMAIGEKLRAAAENACVNSLESCLFFTVSIGVAEAQGQESVDQFLCRADIALREAKYAGRNRVKSA